MPCVAADVAKETDGLLDTAFDLAKSGDLFDVPAMRTRLGVWLIGTTAPVTSKGHIVGHVNTYDPVVKPADYSLPPTE